MFLSTKMKEAIKTALAMTIAYGVGLQMGWDRPYWAGFAVAFISLATVGQSFNKGALRMVGTVMGVAVVLTLIALFAQQRWLFIFFMVLWFGLCTYMMAGSRYQYFWFVGGFVSLIIGVDGGLDPENAFATAMLRVQQTGLGIGVYSLVSLLLWPKSSRAGLHEAVLAQVDTQQKSLAAALKLLAGKGDSAMVKSLHADEIAGNMRLATMLDATTHSGDVHLLENEWRNFQRASAELTETMQRWRSNFTELQSLPLVQLLPELDALALELDRRFAGMTSMLGYEASQYSCTDITLNIDTTALQGLSHFHRAVLLVAQRHVRRIEELTRTLYNSSSAIGGFTDSSGSTEHAPGKQTSWVPDPERLQAAGKIMVLLWLAFLAAIYIGGFPGGLGFVSMCGPVGMNLVTNPQIPVRWLFVPVATSIAFASALYIFVMPLLSSFTGLSLMIFLATFLICYRFASPQQGLGRAVGLALFVVVISVSNQQSYSFLSVATTALMFPLLFLLVTFVAFIPYSPRPERVLLRLLTRYFRSAEFLLLLAAKSEKQAPASWRENFHRQELASLPAKLNVWVAQADPAVLGAESVRQLPALVESLQALTHRLQELLEVRGLPQSPLSVTALTADMQAWRRQVIEDFQRLSADPSYRETPIHSPLDKQLVQLEKNIETHLDGADGDNMSVAEQENTYRLLGAYRGTSLALLDFANVAGNVDWTPWHEERFA